MSCSYEQYNANTHFAVHATLRVGAPYNTCYCLVLLMSSTAIYYKCTARLPPVFHSSIHCASAWFVFAVGMVCPCCCVIFSPYSFVVALVALPSVVGVQNLLFPVYMLLPLPLLSGHSFHTPPSS